MPCDANHLAVREVQDAARDDLVQQLQHARRDGRLAVQSRPVAVWTARVLARSATARLHAALRLLLLLPTDDPNNPNDPCGPSRGLQPWVRMDRPEVGGV